MGNAHQTMRSSAAEAAPAELRKAEKLCDPWLTHHLGQPFELTSEAHPKLSLKCSAGGPAPAEGGEGKEAR